MPTYEVTPEQIGLAILTDAEEREARLVSAIQRTVGMDGPRIAHEEVDATRPLPVDRGEYRRHFEAYNTPRGALFVNSSPHGSIVEDGRRPGRWPPRDAIERWVRRKFRLRLSELKARRKKVVERTWYGRKKTTRLASQRDRAARSIAFLVARKIAFRGIPGKHVMKRTEARLTPIVQAEIEKAMKG